MGTPTETEEPSLQKEQEGFESVDKQEGGEQADSNRKDTERRPTLGQAE